MHFMLSLYYRTGATPNFPDYREIDDLIQAGSVELDSEKRAEIYKQVQIKLSEDIPWFPLHLVNLIMISQPNLKGVYTKGAAGSDVRFDLAYVEQ
jgi:ABC-type transport system substrate-binding protein